jgi:ribulose-bisphosphate carboxylase large chain
MPTINYGRAVYECLRGGLDCTKDDILTLNLSCAFVIASSSSETQSQKHKWKLMRLKVIISTLLLVLLKKCSSEQNLPKKLTLPSSCMTHDFITGISTANTTLTRYCRGNGLLLYIHRTMHAVIDHQKNYGIDFHVLAKCLRLSADDNLHSGTVVGKLEGKLDIITMSFVDLMGEDYIEEDRTCGIFFT